MQRYDILTIKRKGGADIYRLVFTMRAFADFEELAGLALYEITMDKLKPSDWTALVLLGLQDQHPTITLGEVEKLIKSDEQHVKLKTFNAVLRAVGTSKSSEDTQGPPDDFWATVSHMVAALGLAPYEAERFTFKELKERVEASGKDKEQRMEMIAWGVHFLLNIQLPKGKQVTVDDLMGRKKGAVDNAKDKLAELRKAWGHDNA